MTTSLVALVTLTAGLIPAGIRAPVDPSTSFITVELCVQGECDTDTSPIAGFLEVALRCLNAPSDISLHDFDLLATETLDFHLDYGFLGDIFATGTGLGIYHADPGPHNAFVPVVAGQYTFVGVPYLKRGGVQYDAQGLICGIIQGLGLPCQATINLADDPPSTADSMTGSITVAGGNMHLSFTLEFSEPLDPNNPSLGTISGTAVVNGSAPLPAQGDFDLDGDVDLADFSAFQLCFGGSANPPAATCPPGIDADLDCDGDIDLADFTLFQLNFTGSR